MIACTATQVSIACEMSGRPKRERRIQGWHAHDLQKAKRSEELADVHAAELAAALDEEDDETESDSESDHDAVLPDSDSVPNEMPSPIVLKKKAVVARSKCPLGEKRTNGKKVLMTKGKKVSAPAAAKGAPKKRFSPRY